MIEFDRISLLRPDTRPILEDITFTVEPGAFWIVLGPSGCGKSTLLRLLTRLEVPTSGRITAFGRTLGDWPSAELRRKIGYMLPVAAFPTSNILENLLFGRRLRGHITPSDQADAREMLTQVGLAPDFAERAVETCSEGEKQRISLARMLLNQPEVLLLDEPTAALDPVNAREIIELVRRIYLERKLTVLLVSHRREGLSGIEGQVLFLSEGRIREVAAVERFFSAPCSPEAQAYLATEEA